MNVTTMYCDGGQRDVAVVITDAATDDAQANVTGEELACLEVGPHCTGHVCPIGAAAPSAMVHRLIRHGLPTDQLTTVHGHCDACGLVAEFARVGANKASCLVCGSTCAWHVAY